MLLPCMSLTHPLSLYLSAGIPGLSAVCFICADTGPTYLPSVFFCCMLLSPLSPQLVEADGRPP